MGTARTRTALYSETARRKLGDAVAKARDAAGYSTTADLARATGRAARAIYALENAEPTVGQSVLQAVGRTLGERLAGWDEDMPRRILEGQPPPPIRERATPPVESGGLSDEERSMIRSLRRRGWSAEDIAEAIDELRRSSGALPTVEQQSGTD